MPPLLQAINPLVLEKLILTIATMEYFLDYVHFPKITASKLKIEQNFAKPKEKYYKDSLCD